MSAGCTGKGSDELRRRARQLPASVEAKLRAVARDSAYRVQAGARARLRQQTRGTGATAAAIEVKEAPAARAFLVTAGHPIGRHPILPIFLEYGTKKMAARPFMGPALDAESDNYRAGMAAAAADAARDLE